jgi:NAD(P)-dependent dehydrogenase (short-subunit alcohol dehydrogenase family)
LSIAQTRRDSQTNKDAGGEALFIQTDVTQESDVKDMVDKTVEVILRLITRELMAKMPH